MNRVLESKIAWHGSWTNDENLVCKRVKCTVATIECACCEDIFGCCKISCDVCNVPTSQCFLVFCFGIGRYECDVGPFPHHCICVPCFQNIKNDLINRRLGVFGLTKSTHEALNHWINRNWEKFNEY